MWNKAKEKMYDPLKELKVYKELEQELNGFPAPVSVCGCMDSQKVLLVRALAEKRGWVLHVCRDEAEASGILQDYKSLGCNAYFYPPRDLLFYDADVHGDYITHERLNALRHLTEDEKGVLVTAVQGLMDGIRRRDVFNSRKLELEEGMEISIRSLAEILTDMGYRREAQVDAMGQFAIRGGIADIFPVTEEQPLRMEFFDDEIDSIRSFSTESQRSLDRRERLTVYPATEKGGETASLLSYLKDDALLVAENMNALKGAAEELEAEYAESMEKRLEKGLVSEEEKQAGIFSAAETMEALQRPGTLYLSSLDESMKEFGAVKQFVFHTAAAGSYKGSFSLLISDLKKYQTEKYRVSLMTPSRVRASRLAENLREYGIRAYCPDEGKEDELEKGDVQVVCGGLRQGYVYPEIRYVLLTERDMFGTRGNERRRKKPVYKGSSLSSLSELKPGDFVVHESHGIGVYRGLEHIVRDGNGRDYIKLEYHGGDKLYLPAAKLELLQKYTGAEGRTPKLSRLNGTEWEKLKARAQRSADDIARELVKLYAERLNGKGHPYGPDTVWQREFEELFPYEETEDQTAAIEAVKDDMQSGRIMDRLICGDVGYGKTEIALRAAFKAVQEGKQVAYLVPTTILAQQHFGTFCDRMQNFPVSVGMLSSFRTAAENRETVRRLKEGSIDVVIGTHRLLSKDVSFKDLGLLIVDEEQRFGVAHKEKIKQLKTDVDVLTLTATPIPRTLHMSLSGIRDLSLLEEPPYGRVPIQTYVMEYHDELVREAAFREVRRGGQVFYVYNRVKDIAEKTAALRAQLPGLRIEYAHGQMREGELEAIMMDFINGNIDMLVSTTIIETGLDIPNANTLIVDGAERMGLSQLYQIRGRVGRSGRTSYAFLMYRRGKLLTEEAQKRLEAIREFTEFGSGIKIAMRDLEIRGAGNVLGRQQHGDMEAVGYELYVKLLSRAVDELRGTPQKSAAFETSVDADVDAYLPADYIADEEQKLDMYKRIAEIRSEKDRDDVTDELIDRFGDPPEEAMNLVYLAGLRALAGKAYVTELNVKRDGFSMLIHPQADIRVENIPVLIGQENGKLRFSGGPRPRLIYRDEKALYKEPLYMCGRAEAVIRSLMKSDG